jgi:hypothetical protein
VTFKQKVGAEMHADLSHLEAILGAAAVPEIA